MREREIRYPELISQVCRSLQVLRFIVTEHTGDGYRLEVANGLQEVAPRSGSDIEKSDRTPLGVGPLDRRAQRLCQ